MGVALVDEEFVLAQARAGSGTAFEALISPYHHSLYRRALKMTNNEEDAEDVVQDAEWKAFCRLNQFHGSSRFYTWMMRIVINESLMKLRKRRFNLETESLDSILWGGKRLEVNWSRHPGERPDHSYRTIEFNNILNRALSGLSPSLSSTFMLCYVDGYTPREVASMLDLSVAAIKSRLLRARRRVSKRLRAFMQPRASAPLRSPILVSDGTSTASAN
ncbi:MAG TPA: sigma-70 family RNA polymerase sigma factor [Terriglobia bacterium]|nr:sigma-70 family RNA polymerase sigma factor [Terriglobia bacterium]